jgi:site-specific recombinase XerD
MNNFKFSDELSRFYGHFKNELILTNKSKNTIISYNTTITSFIEFVNQYEKKINFQNMKKIDIMNFLEYKNQMLEKHTELKMSSKKLYVTHLKTFFIFINENLDEDIKINTIFKLNIKVPQRTPKGVESDDIKLIENYLNNLSLTNFLNVRASLMLKILLYSGARRSELIHLNINDFKVDNELYIINTIGKGDRERTLYLPKNYVEYELDFYKNNFINRVAATKSGKLMDGSQVYRCLNNLYKKIGINYSGAHILRHTFAKNMIAKDVNIVTVKELLGHASIQTTMIYTNPNQKAIQDSYLKSFTN